MWRHIKMPGRFDPSRWELTLGIGTRELVLITGAALQAVWFIFVQVETAFALRLTLAFIFALALLVIAFVPVQDKPVEQYLWRLVRYKLRPPGRIYRTSERDVREAVPTVVPTSSATDLKPVAVRHSKPRARTLSLGAWVQPAPALIMAAFVCVLVCGSLVAFLGKGGRLEPRQMLAQAQVKDAAWGGVAVESR